MWRRYETCTAAELIILIVQMTLILCHSAIFSVWWSSDINIREKSEVARTRVPTSSEYSAGRIDETPRERAFIVAVARGGPRDQTCHVDRAHIERSSLQFC